MKDYLLYEKAFIQDKNFPFEVRYLDIPTTSLAFYRHWHEQMEILYIINGSAVIECNSQPYEVHPGDLLFINSNEVHLGYCKEKPLNYYCTMFDSFLLEGSFFGSCEQKYIIPIAKNLIVFKNRLTQDTQAIECVKNIIMQSQEKGNGYELFIKSSVYMLIGLLIRDHVEKLMTEKEVKAQVKNLERLNKVLLYIEENYTEPISVDYLENMVCLSLYHFCHLFKTLTGKSVTQYINLMRIDKAELLLKNTDMNITEIAMATGFSDANYFSRIFSKYRKFSPTTIRKQQN
jgi:AraC-like DNA-binding protein